MTSSWTYRCLMGLFMLIHWGWDNMATRMQMTISNAFSIMKFVELWFKIHFKFVAKVQIDNTPVFVQTMPWPLTGNKALPEPMVAYLQMDIYIVPGLGELTHSGRDKMAAISQTTLSNAFSWMKMLEFRYKFHWSLLLRVQLTTFQHWFK